MTISHPPSSRLPWLSARLAVTFPAAEHHSPLAGTKLYCLVTEEHRCKQLAQGCYSASAQIRIWTHDLLIASPTLYPLHHRASYVSHHPNHNPDQHNLPLNYSIPTILTISAVGMFILSLSCRVDNSSVHCTNTTRMFFSRSNVSIHSWLTDWVKVLHPIRQPG